MEQIRPLPRHQVRFGRQRARAAGPPAQIPTRMLVAQISSVTPSSLGTAALVLWAVWVCYTAPQSASRARATGAQAAEKDPAVAEIRKRIREGQYDEAESKTREYLAQVQVSPGPDSVRAAEA